MVDEVLQRIQELQSQEMFVSVLAAVLIYSQKFYVV